MKFPLKDLRATRALAGRIAKALSGRELVLLTGELGSGKTTFVRYLASALGIPKGWVSSPSFTLVQCYPAGRGGFGLTHVDLYRLAGSEEIEGLGLEEILAGDDLVVVEWPEAGGNLWRRCGRPILTVRFSSRKDGTRQATADEEILQARGAPLS
jgi:tRNA threonylcarbamoyladenosine biosynthesis protein TsaE